MNIKSIIDSMTSSEKAEAREYLHEIYRAEMREKSINIVLTEEEKAVALTNKIGAIKMVRDSNKCLLYVAKEAVEKLLEIK